MTESAPLKTVMLIDDEGVDRMIYRRVLNRSKLVDEVIEFEYARDALEYLRGPGRPQVCLIFLDINMPGMNGFEFLEAATAEFGESFADAVVIMLTTSLAPNDVDRSKRYAAVKDYISKPLTVEDVHHAADVVRQMRKQVA